MLSSLWSILYFEASQVLFRPLPALPSHVCLGKSPRCLLELVLVVCVMIRQARTAEQLLVAIPDRIRTCFACDAELMQVIAVSKRTSLLEALRECKPDSRLGTFEGPAFSSSSATKDQSSIVFKDANDEWTKYSVKHSKRSVSYVQITAQKKKGKWRAMGTLETVAFVDNGTLKIKENMDTPF